MSNILIGTGDTSIFTPEIPRVASIGPLSTTPIIVGTEYTYSDPVQFQCPLPQQDTGSILERIIKRQRGKRGHVYVLRTGSEGSGTYSS